MSQVGLNIEHTCWYGKKINAAYWIFINPSLNGSQIKAGALRLSWLCHHRLYAILTLSHSISKEGHTFLWPTKVKRLGISGNYFKELSLSSTHILLRMLNKLVGFST